MLESMGLQRVRHKLATEQLYDILGNSKTVSPSGTKYIILKILVLLS